MKEKSAGISDYVIEVDSITKQFGSGDEAVKAVDNVSFSIERGSIVGLLGPNGAGKTTTINIMLGLVIPTTGNVTVFEENVHDGSFQIYDRVSALFEGARNIYWRLTARENIRLFARMHATNISDDRIDKLVELVGLKGYDDTQVRKLSRGMKQKVTIACILAKDTPIIIFDEPTLGLDVETSLIFQRELADLAERLDKTFLITSHDMDVIQSICDRVIIMQDGTIITDEAVENLVNVFSATTYELEIKVPEDERVTESRLQDSTITTYERIADSNRIRMVVQLTQPDGIYELFDALYDSNAIVHSIETAQTDLQDAFVRITRSEEAAESVEETIR